MCSGARLVAKPKPSRRNAIADAVDVVGDAVAGDEGASADSCPDQVALVCEFPELRPADSAEFTLCVLDGYKPRYFGFGYVSHGLPAFLGAYVPVYVRSQTVGCIVVHLQPRTEV